VRRTFNDRFPLVASLLSTFGGILPKPFGAIPEPHDQQPAPGRDPSFSFDLESAVVQSVETFEPEERIGRLDTTGKEWRKRAAGGRLGQPVVQRLRLEEGGYAVYGEEPEQDQGFLRSFRRHATRVSDRVSEWKRRRQAAELARVAARDADREAYVADRGVFEEYTLHRGRLIQASTQAQVDAAHDAHPCYARRLCAPQDAVRRSFTLVTLSYVFLLLWPQSFCALCNAVVQVNPLSIGYMPATPTGRILFEHALLNAHAGLQIGSGLSTQGASRAAIRSHCSASLPPRVAFYQSIRENAVPVCGDGTDPHLQPASFTAQHVADAHWAYQYTIHGDYSLLFSAAQLLPDYPRGAFAACPACSVVGFRGGVQKVITIASDACFKLWNYAYRAGIEQGLLRFFRGKAHDHVKRDEQSGAPPTEEVLHDCCPTEFRALSDKDRAGVLGNVQANACMGITCCSHGLPGRGSAVYANSGACHIRSHLSFSRRGTERRSMYYYFMGFELKGTYEKLVWGFDAACGIAARTIALFFPGIVRKVVGYVHGNMHQKVREFYVLLCLS